MGEGKIKQRLDLLLIEKGLFTSRNRARAEIMAGNIFVNGQREDKPGTYVAPMSVLEVKNRDNPYVSRGGLKLKKALDHFNIELQGKVVLDIGASTGGFTQCALEAQAEMVIALDVGYGQLAWELRKDPRVIIMERFNARYLKKEDLPQQPDVATIDVSFISLRIILPVIANLEVRELICLIKPQFEASPAQVGAKGVIKDPRLHEHILRKQLELAWSLSYQVQGITFSPIKGPKGNIEYLLHLLRTGDELSKNGFISAAAQETAIRSVVSSAWQIL
jgi:23S rRNA (cytidine1920-2'-O)/16S rRNA (cytidine1409-2'-O)-methyltransferase